MSPSGRKQPLHLPALGLEVASPHPQAVCGSGSVSIIILKPCEHCAPPCLGHRCGVVFICRSDAEKRNSFSVCWLKAFPIISKTSMPLTERPEKRLEATEHTHFEKQFGIT